MIEKTTSYWSILWKQFKQHKLGYLSLLFVGFLVLVAIYAPFLASSQPIALRWRGEWYFPLFRYLFYTGFYTKRIDLFYNLLMFTFPLALIAWQFPKIRRIAISFLLVLQIVLFLFFGWYRQKDPSVDPVLIQKRHQELVATRTVKGDPLLAPIRTIPSWEFDLGYTSSQGELQSVVRHYLRQQRHQRLQKYRSGFADAALNRWAVQEVVERRQRLFSEGMEHHKIPNSQKLKNQILEELSPQKLDHVTQMPTLWQVEQENLRKESTRNLETMERLRSSYPTAKAALMPILEACNGDKDSLGGASISSDFQELTTHCQTSRLSNESRAKLAEYRRIVERYELAAAEEQYQADRQEWLKGEFGRLDFVLMPFLRDFHWEDDAGGEQNLNRFLPWNERTRTNRKDLLSGLLFGIRISLVVGLLAVGLAMMIGIPVGAFAGYYGGKFDIVVSRMLEVWESMPTFFMLLLVVAITQSKSIFLVIAVIGFFGWTGFARYMRGEVFKQRNLSYVEAAKATGLTDQKIIFSHILPNAIPPILTLLPFAIMGAITSEAGLSFLGLGEEGSCSWGVLMDEGRQAFPGESYLLWPPALMLTSLLVAIALVGDALRDSLDPKLRQN